MANSMFNEKRIVEILDAVLKNGDLARITKAELVAVIKFQANQQLPAPVAAAKDDPMVKVYCRKQSCRKAATMPKSKAVNWACCPEHK